jgi:hypothetical protein
MMRSVFWTNVLVAQGGCNPEPIVGGTAAEREILQRELAAFGQAVGEERLEWLVSVEFGPVDGGFDGVIRGGRRITIAPGLDPDWLVRVIRHELCHGLDHAEHLTKAEPAALKALELGIVDGLVDDGAGLEIPAVVEVLAHYCESGPYVAQVGAQPCGGDDPRLTALGSWLMDHVWVEYDAVRYELGPSVGRDLGADAVSYGVSPEQDPLDTAFLQYGAELENGTWIDLTDGSTVEYASSSLVDSVTIAPAFPERPLSEQWGFEHRGPDRDYKGIGLEGGPWVGSYSLQWYYTNPADLLGPSEIRILGLDEEGWWIPADRCMRPGQGVFVTADGVLWSSWFDGTELRWAPFVPR